MYRYYRPGLIVLALQLLSTPVLAAWPGPGHWPAVNSHQTLKVQHKDIGANGAAARVRQATGGRVLSVKRSRGKDQKKHQGKDKKSYQVKVLLKGGRMRVLRVDAMSGALR